MIKTEERLEYSQLLEEFVLGCKNERRIGMEYERIPVTKYGKNVIPYEGEFGMCELLKEFAKHDNWDYIMDGNAIIGLKKLHDTITLEPGCQFELSLEPQQCIGDIELKIKNIDYNICLISLRRTRIGNFVVDQASKVKEVKEEDLISVTKALSHMVVARVEQSLETDIKNGKKVKLSVNEEIVFVINENEDPIAILEKVEENIYRVKRGLF